MNWDYKRVGGLRILKVGRLTFMWTVSTEFAPIGSKPKKAKGSRQFFRGYKAGLKEYGLIL